MKRWDGLTPEEQAHFADAKVAELTRLISLLQERCELLERALNAVLAIVGEEELSELTQLQALLNAPYGTGKTRPGIAFLNDEKMQ